MCQQAKTCRLCQVEKPLSEFTKDNGRPVSKCKACCRQLWAEKYQGRREAKKLREDNWNFTLMMARWLVPGKMENG